MMGDLMALADPVSCPLKQGTISPMRFLTAMGLMFLFVVIGASTAAAHSLEELEGQLGAREKYFQRLCQSKLA